MRLCLVLGGTLDLMGLAGDVCAVEMPNIVLILAEDLWYGDLGCSKKDSKVATRHVDQFVREEMRFTEAHSPSSVCSPTRYSLLTGRYFWRTRFQRNVLGPWDKPLITPERLIVGKVLQHRGYVTACIGIWHLGLTYGTTDCQPPTSRDNPMTNVDFAKAIADGPTTRGFGHYFGTLVTNCPPYCFVENDHTVGPRPVQKRNVAHFFECQAGGPTLLNGGPESENCIVEIWGNQVRNDNARKIYFLGLIVDLTPPRERNTSAAHPTAVGI